MRFERLTDYDQIRETITNPDIYPHLCPDGAPAIEDFKPVESDAFWYCGVWDDDEYLGLWMLQPFTSSLSAMIHTCLLRKAWGKRAIDAAAEFWAWLWANTPFRVVVTSVPACNPRALWFARNGGMKEFAVIPKCFPRGGEMWDEHWLMRHKEAPCPL